MRRRRRGSDVRSSAMPLIGPLIGVAVCGGLAVGAATSSVRPGRSIKRHAGDGDGGGDAAGAAGGLATTSARGRALFGLWLLVVSSLFGLQTYGLPSSVAHTIVRPALSAAGSLSISSSVPSARPLLVAHVAVAVVVSTSVPASSPLRFLADLSALLPGLAVLPVRSHPVAVWCGFEALVLTGVLVAADDATSVARASHLTWWGIAVLALYDWSVASAASHPPGCRAAVGAVLLPLSAVIALGVATMSALGCGMLSSAHADAGAGLYFVGNFLMHYYPLIRGVAAATSVPSSVPSSGGSSATGVGEEPPGSPAFDFGFGNAVVFGGGGDGKPGSGGAWDHPAAAAAGRTAIAGGGVRAAALVLLYSMVYRPTVVYDCSTPPPWAAPPFSWLSRSCA